MTLEAVLTQVLNLLQRQGIPFVPTLSSRSFTRRLPDGSWPRRLIGPEEGNLASDQRDRTPLFQPVDPPMRNHLLKRAR